MNTLTDYRTPRFPWLLSGLGLALLILLLILGNGCTVSRLHSDNASVTTYTVAWPWLDTTRAVDKARITSATNKSEINLSGYAESEKVSTNAAAFQGELLGTAIKAFAK